MPVKQMQGLPTCSREVFSMSDLETNRTCGILWQAGRNPGPSGKGLKAPKDRPLASCSVCFLPAQAHANSGERLQASEHADRFGAVASVYLFSVRRIVIIAI